MTMQVASIAPDTDGPSNASAVGFEWSTTIGIAIRAFHLWRSSRDDSSRGRVASVVPLQPTRKAFGQLRLAMSHSVDRCFDIVDSGLARLESLVDDIDRWLDTWLPRPNVAPLSPPPPFSEPSRDTPVTTENAVRKRSRARVRCIVATPSISVESNAAIDPVPPLRRKNRPRTTTQISTILEAQAEEAPTHKGYTDATRTDESQTDDVRADERAPVNEDVAPTTVAAVQPLISPLDDTATEFVPPTEADRAAAVTANPENSSSSAHGRGQRLAAGVDGIGLVGAGHENRSARPDQKRTAAFLWSLLIHHLLAGVLASRDRAQEFFGELLSEIISSVRCAAIWIGKERVRVIGAVRAVALKAFTRIHGRLRATTLLLKHRPRQTRSKRRRKPKKGAQKNRACPSSRRATRKAKLSRRERTR